MRIFFKVVSSLQPYGAGTSLDPMFFDDRESAEKAAKHNALGGFFSYVYRCGQVIDGELMPPLYLCEYVAICPADMVGGEL